MKFIHSFKISDSGSWEVTSNKNDKYVFMFYFGKVTRESTGDGGWLLCFGPVYWIFNIYK